jgi:hypothetical protein
LAFFSLGAFFSFLAQGLLGLLLSWAKSRRLWDWPSRLGLFSVFFIFGQEAFFWFFLAQVFFI